MNRIHILRKSLCAALAFAGLLAAAGAQSQEYPSKSIEMVVAFPPGGRSDLLVRLLSPYLEKDLGQPIIVSNKVGGGGLVAFNYMKNAKPDGYILSTGGIGLSAMQYQRKTDLTLWDFTYVARIYSLPMILAVPANSQFKTLKQLVDFARANPGKLRHGNSGPGGSTHIASAAMAKKLGLVLAQVPYKGEGPSVVGLAGAETDFSLGIMVAFRPFVEGGKLRLLGVADVQRDPSASGVPTFKEQGFDFQHAAFESLYMPKGAPPAVVDRLSRSLRDVLSNPEVKQKFETAGLAPGYQDGPTFVTFLHQWDLEMKTLITELGLLAKD